MSSFIISRHKLFLCAAKIRRQPENTSLKHSNIFDISGLRVYKIRAKRVKTIRQCFIGLDRNTSRNDIYIATFQCCKHHTFKFCITKLRHITGHRYRRSWCRRMCSAIVFHNAVIFAAFVYVYKSERVTRNCQHVRCVVVIHVV